TFGGNTLSVIYKSKRDQKSADTVFTLSFWGGIVSTAILSSMTAYMNTAHGKKITALNCNSHFTTQILARLGFFWNASNEKYVNDFINVLRGFLFFRQDNLTR
ncbi:MAG: hypothetical protein IJR57_07180, partial [Ruminococcus sp.]|nr:hypothetical protein [Ruminococcus sp.]